MRVGETSSPPAVAASDKKGGGMRHTKKEPFHCLLQSLCRYVLRKYI